MTNDYHFLTRWLLPGNVEDAHALISDPPGYTRWWPSVYLDVQEIDTGDRDGVGRSFRLHTKGWLPYTLHWESRAIEIEKPHRLVIRATGDFNGRGLWTLRQQGTAVEIEFDWKLSAEKPLIRYLSFLLKPIFSANHQWAMAQGREGLARELARRAGKNAKK